MAKSTSGGLAPAIATYVIWGLLPLYLRALQDVPPVELIGWRALFTVPVCFAIVALRRNWAEVRAAVHDPRVMALLLVSALLIGGNWLTYVVAIQQGHVLATSLGYYINPLVNVLAGTLFLKERLSARQWFAVALATIGVGVLAWGARDMLGIALVLALTFAGYGLVRKLAPVTSLPGLTIESTLLSLPAAGIIACFAAAPAGLSLGRDVTQDVLLALSGVITAVPLLLFAVAARRLDYSVLGFCQFLAPTLIFLQALFVFGEPLKPVQLASFGFIWAAVALFSWDMWSRARQARL